MMSLVPVDLDVALDSIARAVLGVHAGLDPRLGRLTLRDHQVVAVSRLLEIMGRFRGALLADAVGLGKTYVALAIAREHSRPLIVCPAALRGMWDRATATAGLHVPVLTIESMALGDHPNFSPDVVIVDEAHHLRTASTRRYQALATLARSSRILLMSATPVHNSRRDLLSLLGLFAGSGVSSWTDAEIGRLVVRRDEGSAALELPPLDGPHVVSPCADDDCLDLILATPAAVPAADEGTAAALATMSMVHLWASSRAALVASVKKRRARALALRDAIASGHLPTASELGAWQYGDDALQLAFPFCAPSEGSPIDKNLVSARLDAYIAAIEQLLTHCRSSADPDAARISMLRQLRGRHIGERVVAFSQYAHTVTALGKLMRPDPGIAVVTADGAHVAGGTIPREDVLAQLCVDAPAPRRGERIDLVLTTDLLSEGIDLRGASVIVHLDLPWNPARMEQRVGRARRLGSRHSAIHVYAFAPPTAAERMLEIRRRLQGKISVAATMLGGVHDPLGSATHESSRSVVTAGEQLRGVLSRWILPSPSSDEGIHVAAAISDSPGWIAAVLVDGLPRLIQFRGGEVSSDPQEVVAACEGLSASASVDLDRARFALRTAMEWIGSREAEVDAGVLTRSSSRRAVLDRITQTVSRAPRHRRTAVLASAHRARESLSGAIGIGAERVLSTLARASGSDEGWLHSVEAFGAAWQSAVTSKPEASQVMAIVLLTPATDATR